MAASFFALLIQLIWSAFIKSAEEIYVKNNNCDPNMECVGLFTFPCCNIINVLARISKKESNHFSNSINIILLDEVNDLISGKDPSITKDMLIFRLYNQEVAIFPLNSSSNSKILVSGLVFSFEISGARLKLMNLDVLSKGTELNILNKADTLIEGNKSEGFIHIKAATNNSALEIINCVFLRMSANLSENFRLFSYSFLSFIYAEQRLNNNLDIVIRHSKFNNTYFPRGIISAYGDSICENEYFLKIVMEDIEVFNWTNPVDFFHWKLKNYMREDSRKYYDFALNINNSNLAIRNLKVIDSSRILIAEYCNLITIQNLNFTNNYFKLGPPEFIYILYSNKLFIDKIFLYNLTISGFDDEVNKDPDCTLLGYPFKIPSHMDFERNQAFLKLAKNNELEFVNSLFENGEVIKLKSFTIALLHAEESNIVKMRSFFLKNISLITEARIGSITLVLLGDRNELSIESSSIKDFYGGSFSVTAIIFIYTFNSLNISGFNLADCYIKTKANTSAIWKFETETFANPASLMYINSLGSLLVGSFLTAILENKIEISYFISTTFYGLYAGIAAFLQKNVAFLFEIVVDVIVCETSASTISFFSENVAELKNILIKSSRAFSGAIDIFMKNNITIKKSFFEKGRVMGMFGFYVFWIGGSLRIANYNTVFLSKVKFQEGISDLKGAVFSAGSFNEITLVKCSLSDNQALSTNSKGGGISLEISNLLTISESVIEASYAYFGGFLCVTQGNNVTILNSFFDENQGEIGGVFYLNTSNVLILENCSFDRNQAFALATILTTETSNVLIQFDECKFHSNISPLTGVLFNISKSNLIELTNLFVDYGYDGNGAFLLLDIYNNVKLINFTFGNLLNLIYLIEASNKNNLTLINGTFSNLTVKTNLFFLKAENIFVGKELTFFQNNLEEKGATLINANSSNYIVLNESLFQLTLFSNSNLLLASSNNSIEFYNNSFTDFTLNNDSSMFQLNFSNKILFSSGLIQRISGTKGDVFLLYLNDSCSASFINFRLFGKISSEGSEKPSSLFKLAGIRTNLTFKGFEADIQQSWGPFQTDLIFLSAEGFNNSVYVAESAFKLKNFSNLILCQKENIFFIFRTKFLESLLKRSLITIIHSSELTFLKCIIMNNSILSKGEYLFDISKNSNIKMRNIIVKTASNFFQCSWSKVKIEKSRFFPFKEKYTPQNNVSLFNFKNFSNITLYLIDIVMLLNHKDSVVKLTVSSLNISRCLFAFNQALYGGVLNFEDKSNVTAEKSYFLINKAYLGGVFFTRIIGKLTLRDNILNRNAAYRYNSIFASMSPGKGGLIYTTANEKALELSNIIILRNVFTGTFAEIGGILFFNETEVSKLPRFGKLGDVNKFVRTKISCYGSIIATPLIKVMAVVGDDLNVPPKLIINSGLLLPTNKSVDRPVLQLIGLDGINQTAYRSGELMPTRSLQLSGYSLFFTEYNGFPSLTKVTPKDSANLNELIFKKTEILIDPFQFLKASRPSFMELPLLKFSFSVRKCSIGEYFNIMTLECLKCDPNFFSFEKDFVEPSSCKSCAKETFNCYGGFDLTPKANYWRSGSLSKNFIKCPSKYACLGDPEVDAKNPNSTTLLLSYKTASPQGVCAMGYEGTLCYQCSSGYSKTTGHRCVPCNGVLNFLLMILKMLLRIFLYFYLISKAFMLCMNVKKDKIKKEHVSSNFMIKIIVMHMQFLRVFMSFPFNFPDAFVEILLIFSNSINSGVDDVMNIDCFFSDVSPKKYIMTVSSILIPLLIMSLIWLFNKIKKKINIFLKRNQPKSPSIRKQSSESFSGVFMDSSFTYMMIITIMLSYDEILSNLLLSFSSLNINDEDSPEYRMVDDYEVEFDSKKHVLWRSLFAGPFTFLIGIALPLFIVSRIWVARKNNMLNDQRTLFRFGYFYFAYSHKYVFYELFYLLRKIMLIIIEVFFLRVFYITKNLDPNTFLILMCLVYSALMYFVTTRAPYQQEKYHNLNKIERIFLVSQAGLSCFGCFVLSFDNSRNSLIFEWVNLAFFVYAIACNSFLAIAWVQNYWMHSARQRIASIIKIVKRMKTKRRNQTISKANKLKKQTQFQKIRHIDMADSLKEVELEIFQNFQGDQKRAESPGNREKTDFKKSSRHSVEIELRNESQNFIKRQRAGTAHSKFSSGKAGNKKYVQDFAANIEEAFFEEEERFKEIQTLQLKNNLVSAIHPRTASSEAKGLQNNFLVIISESSELYGDLFRCLKELFSSECITPCSLSSKEFEIIKVSKKLNEQYLEVDVTLKFSFTDSCDVELSSDFLKMYCCFHDSIDKIRTSGLN